MSSLTPANILEAPTVSKKRFDKAVDILLDSNLISTSESDRALQQFGSLMSNQQILAQLKSFDVNEHRLDVLYSGLIGSDLHYVDLWKCVKVSF